MIIIELLALVGVGCFGSRGLIKNKWWRDLTFYIIFYVIGLTLTTLLLFGVKLPYFFDVIEFFFKNKLHFGYR